MQLRLPVSGLDVFCAAGEMERACRAAVAAAAPDDFKMYEMVSTAFAAQLAPLQARGCRRQLAGGVQHSTHHSTRHDAVCKGFERPLAQSLCAPRQADPGFQARLLAHRAGVHALKTWSVE